MISAVAIALNEEQNIQRYIESLRFAEEIIIVDSGSSDKTVDLATKLGAKIISREFDNFSNQKNFALQQAQNEWVTFFDLDEIVTPELAAEITHKTKKNGEVTAYKVRRENYFMGKKINYSGFQNDEVIRLFQKSHCNYDGSSVHETLIVRGKIASLENQCKHVTYKDFDSYNNKLSLYSKLQAERLFDENLRPNVYHFLVRPFYRFVHQYFIRLGILDGKEGYILAYLSAFAVFKRYIFLWTMYRKLN